MLLACLVLVASLPAAELDISIVGNEQVTEKVLREAAADDLAAAAAAGASRAAADDAAYQMLWAYRKRGYANARVRPEWRSVGDQTALVFRIEEGALLTVDALTFPGAESFPRETLSAWLDLPQHRGRPLFVVSQMRSAAERLVVRYRQAGYLDVEVQGPQVDRSVPSKIAVSYQIAEGIRYQVSALVFEVDLPTAAAAVAATLERELLGSPFAPHLLLVVSSRLKAACAEAGHADSAITTEAEYDRAAGTVRIRVGGTVGPAITLASVQLRGLEQTRESFVRSRLDWAAGDAYGLSHEQAAYDRLYRTGLFSRIHLGLQPTSRPTHRDLIVELTETPTREYFSEVGWGSYERLRLQLGGRELSLFGSGRSLQLSGALSTKSQGAELQLTDPWFLASEVTADLPLSWRRREEPAFTEIVTSGSLLFSATVAPRTTLTVGWRFSATETSDLSLQTAVSAADTYYLVSALTAQLVRDTRDNLVQPAGGSLAQLAVEITDGSIGSDLSFVRVSAGLRRYWALHPRLVLAARYRTGLVLPAQGAAVPVPERWYTGGETSVRSFAAGELGPRYTDGTPVGGLATNTASLELRQQVWRSWRLAAFADFGNISPNDAMALDQAVDRNEALSATLSDFWGDWRPAVGAGILYDLPIGPARLDFAVNPDRRPGENRYRVHFSIGLAF